MPSICRAFDIRRDGCKSIVTQRPRRINRGLVSATPLLPKTFSRLNQSRRRGIYGVLRQRRPGMRQISVALLILPLLAADPILALAMGGAGAGAGGAGAGGSSAGAGGGGAGPGGSSAGAGGAGSGAPINAKRHVVPPAASAQAYEHPTSDAVKDPLLVQSRPRSVLLERPGRQ